MRRAPGWITRAVLALLLAGGPAAQGSGLYHLSFTADSFVEAHGPFANERPLSGFIELPEAAMTGAVFAAPPDPRYPALPVIGFRFQAGDWEWTPVTGRFAIVGRTDERGRIVSLIFGAQRRDCGPDYQPCWLDIVGESPLRAMVHRPGDRGGAGQRVGLIAHPVFFAPPVRDRSDPD